MENITWNYCDYEGHLESKCQVKHDDTHKNHQPHQHEQANIAHEDTDYDYSEDDQESHSESEETDPEDAKYSNDGNANTTSQDDNDFCSMENTQSKYTFTR